MARGLRRCFGMETSIVTALVENPIGRLVQDLIYQGDVDQSHVKWVDFDGVGRSVRNGLNFTERGFGLRAALGCSNRGHTAVSQLKTGDIDWERIFGDEGVRWFHTARVSLKTAADFIKAGAIALGVGADLVDPKALREGNSALVTERARQFLEIVQLTRASCA